TSGVAWSRPAGADGACNRLVLGWAAAGASGAAAASLPITTSTVPTGTMSPSATRIFETRPAAGDGISTVVLSVAISTSGASSAISSPSATSQRAISPSIIPSPKSGSLNAYGTDAEASSPPRPAHPRPGRHEQHPETVCTGAPQGD